MGGGSRRMGRPKTQLRRPDGTSFVGHVAGVASQVAAEVVVLGSNAELPPSLAHLPTLPDARPDSGPLAGLCSLLTYVADRWALLLACDMPCLAPEVLRTLWSHAGPGVDAVAFARGDGQRTYHACCALYHPGMRAMAEQELATGRASLQRVLSRVRVAALTAGPEDESRLANVNTPEDLRRLFPF